MLRGGSLLALLDYQQGNLFALVDHPAEAAELQQHVSAKVLVASLHDGEQVRSLVLEHSSADIHVFATGKLPNAHCSNAFSVQIVIETTSPYALEPARHFLNALVEVDEEKGVDCHYIHVSGTALYSLVSSSLWIASSRHLARCSFRAMSASTRRELTDCKTTVTLTRCTASQAAKRARGMRQARD